MQARLRSPITARTLVAACGVLGVSVDVAITTRGAALLEAPVGPDTGRDLEALSYFTVSKRRTESLSEDLAFGRMLAGAVAAGVAVAVDDAARTMTPLWETSGVPARGKTSPLLKALGGLSLGEYRAALDAPLGEVLSWFHLQNLHAMDAEDAEDRTRRTR
jgi:hypothetical protein